ncbi:hypothetical protein BJV78DRAFT_269951 [Lactifluus subvellereus]|nr:hypothetical protein BJV78DRAFT_269951 [Lactifluus subvellereus]
MRAFLCLLIAGAVSAVSAFIELNPRQNPYPACAQACLAKADLGKCTAQEVQCLCTEQSFVVSTTQCFQQNCDNSDLQVAEKVAEESCKAAGVTLTSSIPPTTATATSPGASKSNSAASPMVNVVGGAAALGLAALVL